jgi:AraC-like DNA-binding protein
MARSRYPWQLLPKLASEIEHGQRTEALRDLDALLEIIAESSGAELNLRKLRCAQLVSGCLRGAHAGGAPSETLLDQNLRVLKTLTTLATWKSVTGCIHRYVDRLLRQVRTEQRTHMERVVARVRTEMRTTAGMSRSLAQHAEVTGVSVGHLSRSFAAIVGRTYREELRRTRVETGCRLLRETDLKISLIAHRVGVRDPSQFVSAFRRETGVTPGVYRLRHQT